jgi:hypothetical protein
MVAIGAMPVNTEAMPDGSRASPTGGRGLARAWTMIRGGVEDPFS